MDFYGVTTCKRGQKSERFSTLELCAVYLAYQVKIVNLHKSHLKEKIGGKKFSL